MLLETPYTSDITGSVEGSGEYGAHVRPFPQPATGTDAISCTIADNGNLQEQSCPGGATLSQSGPLTAGIWRLNVFAGTSVGPTFAGSAAFDFVLTLSPE